MRTGNGQSQQQAPPLQSQEQLSLGAVQEQECSKSYQEGPASSQWSHQEFNEVPYLAKRKEVAFNKS